MNKQITAAALALAATLTLVGCGATTRDTAPPSTTTYRPTTTTTNYDPGLSNYLRKMRMRFPGRSDSELIEIGTQSCVVIDAAGSIIDAMVGIAEDPEWTVEMAGDAGYTFGLAVPMFCPEYVPELSRIAR